MDVLNKVLGEKEEDLLSDRVSVLFFVTYWLYLIFYYVAIKKNVDLQKQLKQSILPIIMLGIFHLIQFFGMKYFFLEKNIKRSWFLVVVPMIVYMLYIKYMERQKMVEKEKYEKFKKLMLLEQKIKDAQNPSTSGPTSEFIMKEKKLPGDHEYQVMPNIGSVTGQPPRKHFQGNDGVGSIRYGDMGGNYLQQNDDLSYGNQMMAQYTPNDFGENHDLRLPMTNTPPTYNSYESSYDSPF